MADPLTLIRVVDTETTGMDDPAEMVEIGWTDVRLFHDGWQIERGPESYLVDPAMPITFPAMAVHHITPAMVHGQCPADDARGLIRHGVDIFCSHNWQFDSRFLKAQKPYICTLKAARVIWPNLQGHSNGSIRYELGLVPHDDQRAQPSHRAGPDTWVTAHILLKLLETHTVEQLLDISANPIRLLKFPGGNKHRGVSFSEIARIDPNYLRWVVDKSELNEDVKYSSVLALREARR